MIVRGLLPVTIIRQKGFREFCEEMDPLYVLPNYNTVRNKLIPDLDQEVMSEVRKDLKQVKHVAMTSDGWSSNVSTTL